MRTFVIPFLKKKLKNSDEVVAILDDNGIAEIDALYIPSEAVKRYNTHARETILTGGIPPQFDSQAMQAGIKQELSQQGNKRFFKPSDIDKETWSELFSDFEWDSIRVEVTSENFDKRATLQTLTQTLSIISGAAQQGRQLNPDEKMILSMILRETGQISPIQLSTAPPPAPPAPPTTPSMVGAGGGLPAQQ